MVISKLLLQVNLRLSFRLNKIKSILFFILALLTKLNAYVAETNYSWDGQVLKDEVITWRPPGAWDLTTAQSYEFGVSYYLRNTEFGSAIITVAENMYISQNLSEWVDGQIDGQANTVPAESEWISEFTTQIGYLAKAIYQEKPFGFSTNQTKVALAAKKTNSDYNVAVTFTITSNDPKSLDDIKSLVGNFTLNKISGNQENTSNEDSSSNDASTDDSTTSSGSTNSSEYIDDEIEWDLPGDSWKKIISTSSTGMSMLSFQNGDNSIYAQLNYYYKSIVEKGGSTWLTDKVENTPSNEHQYFKTQNGYEAAVTRYVPSGLNLDSFNIYIRAVDSHGDDHLIHIIIMEIFDLGMTIEDAKKYTKNLFLKKISSSTTDQISDEITVDSFFSLSDVGSDWSESSWFGYCWTGSNNLWIYHTLLGWLYIHLNDDNSVWMYSHDLDIIPFWLWTRPDVFPYMYLIRAGSNEISDGFWIHLDIKSGLIRNWINQSWAKFIDLVGNDTSSNDSSNNNSSNNSSNSAESDISSNTQKASLLSAGEASTLVVLDDGTLWVSGSNYYSGKLRTTPTEPNTFKKIDNGPVTHVQSYGTKTYFIKQDQTLWGLGSNINGIPSTATTVPTQILNPDKPQDWTGYTGLAVGYNHAVFTKSDGKLYGIGDSSVGQLGFDEYMNSAIPMTKQTRPFPIEIPVTNPGIPLAGGSHTLYYNLFGELWGSGDNTNGQLGDGTTINKMSFAKIIDSGVTSVSTNSGHTLFVKSDGSLWGMGSNWSGALGDGSTTDRISPVQIVNSGVRSSSAGAMHSAFIKTDGSLWVMGAYKGGQMADSTTPVKIVNSDVATVSCGVGFTVFLKTDGSLWGFGANGSGQLGLDAENPQLTPLELFKFPISSAPSSNESSDNSSDVVTDSSDTTSNDNTDTSTDNSDTPPTDNSDTGDDNQNNDSSIIPPEFIWPNEELDLLALDEFMKSQNHQYKKQASGETVAEVSYDSSWDISRDRRADKYSSFNGVLQSYSPMRYTEINIDDPNGYNDILHSDIQGPFGDGLYFLVHDERTLSTEQKEEEVIAINGTEYSAYVYEIKEVIMFFSSIPPGDPEGLPIDSRTDYYEDRTRTLWVNKDKGLLKWTEENILYSETYGMGSAASPYIDDAYSYTLILDPTAVPSTSSFNSDGNSKYYKYLVFNTLEAGSTVDLDDISIIDSATGKIVWSENFNYSDNSEIRISGNDNNFKLDLLSDFDFTNGVEDDWYFDPTLTKVTNKRLRLETVGFKRNWPYGGGTADEGYFSESIMFFENLPKNFSVQFKANKLQYNGHFRIFLKDSYSRSREQNTLVWHLDGYTLNSPYTWDSDSWKKSSLERYSIDGENDYRIDKENNNLKFYLNGNFISEINVENN